MRRTVSPPPSCWTTVSIGRTTLGVSGLGHPGRAPFMRVAGDGSCLRVAPWCDLDVAARWSL